MNIHEYQAKEILRAYGIMTNRGIVILEENISQIDAVINALQYNLFVVKAQIHAGGRGKAGGVKVCKTKEDAALAAKNMMGMNLVTYQNAPHGSKVRRVYIEDGSNIAREMYLSLVVDRSNSCITIICGAEGGVDIESSDNVKTIFINPRINLQDFHILQALSALNLQHSSFKELKAIITGLYNIMFDKDASQIEINPLILNENDKLLALDAKITFDDNGLYRQESIKAYDDENEHDPNELMATKANLSYVTMDGDIACVVNGAGLAMATMDIIQFYGEKPANFLDIGGGADEHNIAAAFAIIANSAHVSKILVNIFGGIVKCDLVAAGIINAVNKFKIVIPIIVRLEGTNSVIAKQLLEESKLNIIFASSLKVAAEKIANLTAIIT